jgi:peptidyl-prolyl cis-trans isomerase A (cyclophilin A)
MNTIHRLLGIACTAWALASCGGGGGSGGSSGGAVASGNSFNLQAGMQRLRSSGLSANFAVTDSCSGSYAVVQSAALADSRLATATSSAVSYATANYSDCRPNTESSAWTDYFNANGMLVARTGLNHYTVPTSAETYPTAAKVGDAGLVLNTQEFSDSNLSTLTGSTVVSYALDADTGSTAILSLTTKTYDTATPAALVRTALSRYRVAADGSLNWLSQDLRNTVGQPAHLAYAPAPAASQCSASGVAASDAAFAADPTVHTVCMMTDLGEIVLALEPLKAPATVANFLSYVTTGFYDNTIFHRLLSGFVIQGGGYSYSASGYTLKNTNAPIALEPTGATGLSNVRGTITMARSSAPNTATSQFFLNAEDNSSAYDSQTAADGFGYAVFGHVLSGIEAVDAFKTVPVTGNGATPAETSLPVLPLHLLWARRLK